MQNKNSLFCLFLIPENHWPGIVKRLKTENFCSAYILHNHKQRNLKLRTRKICRTEILCFDYFLYQRTRNSQNTEFLFCIYSVIINRENWNREYLACNLKNSQNRDFKLCHSPFRNMSLHNNHTIKRATTTENFIHSPENLCFTVFLPKKSL